MEYFSSISVGSALRPDGWAVVSEKRPYQRKWQSAAWTQFKCQLQPQKGTCDATGTGDPGKFCRLVVPRLDDQGTARYPNFEVRVFIITARVAVDELEPGW
jgi:hypothetical protein